MNVQTKRDEMFRQDAMFAKVVSTPDGAALRVGGEIFYVIGPDGNAAELFATALRSEMRSGVSEATPEEMMGPFMRDRVDVSMLDSLSTWFMMRSKGFSSPHPFNDEDVANLLKRASKRIVR